MSENSSIEWTNHTFNPVRGCTKVSPGCVNCYAARDAVRFPNIRGIWGDKGTRIVAVPDAWKAPLKWHKKALKESPATRPRVFCASLADVFEDWKGILHFPTPYAADGLCVARWDGKQLVREIEPNDLPTACMDHVRVELFDLIRQTSQLDWLLLTKRPENVVPMIERVIRMVEPDPSFDPLRDWLADWALLRKAPDNAWIGTTVEDQARAVERVPILIDIPAKVRFLSCEPLLDAVDLRHIHDADGNTLDALTGDWGVEGRGHTGPSKRRVDWVIAGGESGPAARPMHPAWAKSLRDQCQAACVPFLFKQWGEHVAIACPDATWKDGTPVCPDLEPVIYQKVGKKAAGRILEGREWNEFPMGKEGA
jgi:protein gp37